MIRYRILNILDAGRPLPVGENLISQVLTDVDLNATQQDLRRALQYLEDKNYVEIKKPRPGISTYWEARLLPKGVDYVEDANIHDSGIARPAS